MKSRKLTRITTMTLFAVLKNFTARVLGLATIVALTLVSSFATPRMACCTNLGNPHMACCKNPAMPCCHFQHK